MTDISTSFVTDVLRHYDISVTRVNRLAVSFNTLFTVDSADARYLLRVGPELRIHDVDSPRAEAAWTEQLAAAGVAVPRLIRTTDGAPAMTVADGPVTRTCTMFTWIDGQTLPRPMSVTDAEELGGLAARLHAASPSTEECPSGALDGRNVLLFQLPDLLDRASEAGVFRAALVRARAAIDRLWTDPAGPPQRLHGDLTAGNVVRCGDRLVPIDFQDMFWGYPQQDVAHSLFSYLRHDDGTFATAFRRGYEKHRRWPDFDAVRIEDLFAARRLMMVNLALALDRPGLDDYLAMHAAALRTYLTRPDPAL